ncbi:MAG: hypothetical protein QGG53_45430 [Planctomycetota bacterium]|nr:hypothetical protein [Planctomycetota bacterium]
MCQDSAEETPDKEPNAEADIDGLQQDGDGGAETTDGSPVSSSEESESQKKAEHERPEAETNPEEGSEPATEEDEGSVCPSCGRAVVMKTRATCAYCGVELPWAINEESDEQENPQLNIAELLGSSNLTRQLASGATYPVACGACGESLPQEEKPETCPGCHAMVRDPYSGKLVYAEETANNTSTVRIVFLIAMLLACACAAVYIFKLLSRVTPP